MSVPADWSLPLNELDANGFGGGAPTLDAPHLKVNFFGEGERKVEQPAVAGDRAGAGTAGQSDDAWGAGADGLHGGQTAQADVKIS